MLTYTSISGHAPQFDTSKVFVFGLITFICATLQLISLNAGLAKHDAVLFLPLYSGLLIVSSTVLGGVFYNEFKCFSVVDGCFFPVGIFVVLYGMSMLVKREEVQSEKQFVLLEKDGAY